MADEKVEVSLTGLARLQSAAKDFARSEIARISEAVVDELRSRSAIGAFGDVAARHIWDEYCWNLQERSASGNWRAHVGAFAHGEMEKLPNHALVFLSALFFDEDDDRDEDEEVGSIWIEGIVSAIMEEIDSRAAQRNLDLIGPGRAEVIGHVIAGSGMVWSALSDRGEATDLISSHVDAMIDPDAELSELASELVEAFMAAAEKEVDLDGTIVTEFLQNFEPDIRALLIEKDVLPALQGMRLGLLKWLDG